MLELGAEMAEDVRQATREITKRFDRTYWVGCVDEQRQPMELLRALGDSGLLGLGVPPQHGGQGGGLLEQVALVEELGRAGLPSYSFLIGNFARHTVLRHGTDEQIRSFVPPTLTGATFTSFALTEPDAGTNTFAMRTTAERTATGWTINGQKCFITAAREASQMMVVARTDGERGSRDGLSIFILELPNDRIETTLQRIKAAAPDNQYIVFFDGVEVGDDALLGEQGAGARYLFDALNSERIIGAAMAVGLGHFTLDKGVLYAKERAPFGRAVGSYQAVSHPMARAHVQLEASRRMVYDAARGVDAGRDVAYESSAAKYLASEAANAALDVTIQAHGGWAFDYDYDVVTLYETLRLFRVAPINNDMVLNQVAEHVLGLPRGR